MIILLLNWLYYYLMTNFNVNRDLINFFPIFRHFWLIFIEIPYLMIVCYWSGKRDASARGDAGQTSRRAEQPAVEGRRDFGGSQRTPTTSHRPAASRPQSAHQTGMFPKRRIFPATGRRASPGTTRVHSQWIEHSHTIPSKANHIANDKKLTIHEQFMSIGPVEWIAFSNSHAPVCVYPRRTHDRTLQYRTLSHGWLEAG